MPEEDWVIHPLGGMHEGANAPFGAAERIVNLRRDSEGWHFCGGTVPYGNADAPSQCGSVHWFSQHNGQRQWLVAELVIPASNDHAYMLCAFNSSYNNTLTDGWWLPIDSRDQERVMLQSPWQGTQYMATAGWLYYINGYDEPARWDGRRRQRIGFDQPPSTPIVQALIETHGAASAHGLGTPNRAYRYGYALSYINDRGMESPLGQPATLTGTNANALALARVEWGDCPEHVAAVRVWRTVDITVGLPTAASTFYLHSTITTGLGQVIRDQKSDAELGQVFDDSQVGFFPPGAQVLCLFQGRCFVAGTPEYPDRVWYSPPGAIEQFPPENYFDLGSGDSGVIRSLYASNNAVVVGKTRGLYLIKPTADGLGLQAATLTEDVGVSAPNTVCEVPGQGLLFVSDAGVMLLQGALENTGAPTRVVNISAEALAKTWRSVNCSALLGACACVNHKDQEVWISVPTGGSGTNTLGIIYHYPTGEWSLRANIDGALYEQRPWVVSCMCETKDHRGLLLMGSTKYGADPRGVYAYVRGKDTSSYDEPRAFGSALVCEYRTGWMRLGDERGLMIEADLKVAHLGNRLLRMAYRIDHQLEYEGDDDAPPAGTAELRKMLDSESERPAWQTATWAPSEHWSQRDPTTVVFPLEARGAHDLQLQFISGFDLNAGGPKTSFMGLSLKGLGTTGIGQRDQTSGDER